jgi:hypothetical protein
MCLHPTSDDGKVGMSSVEENDMVRFGGKKDLRDKSGDRI